jgi:pyruvate,water dikinase
MPGVQTPLSWSVWAGGNERALREAAYAIGALTRHERVVPHEINQRLLRVFRGRPALNVEFMTRIGDRMPGTSGPQAAISLLGRTAEGIDYQPTRRRYPIIAWRFPATFLRTPARLRSFAQDTDTWYSQQISRVDDLDEAATRALFSQAVERFTEAIEIQTVSVLAVIQPLYEALQQLVTRAGVGDVAVLSGSGGAEMQVVRDIWLAAHDQLPLDRVVAAHGFHGPAEGELSSRVWREDSAPLHKLLHRYADRPDPGGASRDTAAMQRALLTRLPAHLRPPARLILRLSQDRIQLRGVVKRSFLQCFDVTRAAARRLGQHLAANRTLADAEDIFYLTVSELRNSLPAQTPDVVA